MGPCLGQIFTIDHSQEKCYTFHKFLYKVRDLTYFEALSTVAGHIWPHIAKFAAQVDCLEIMPTGMPE